MKIQHMKFEVKVKRLNGNESTIITKTRRISKMVVYNLYLVLNDEPIEIYDKNTRQVIYEGSSNDIPKIVMERLVHYLSVVNDKEGRYIRTIIVID